MGVHMFRLEKPSIKHKALAYALLEPYLAADGGIEGCAGLDCFLQDKDYEGWLANLEALLREPNLAALKVFSFMEGDHLGKPFIFKRGEGKGNKKGFTLFGELV